MEDKSKTSTDIFWPSWLLAAGNDMSASLDKIKACHQSFCKAVQRGYIHEHVFQGQVTAITDQLITEQLVDPKTGRVDKRLELSGSAGAVMLYQHGSAHRTFQVICIAKQMVLVHLLDAMASGLMKGNLFAGLICLRSVIEHVAHFDAIVAEIRPYSVPSEYEEANDTLWEMNGKLAKSVYATRVDWFVLGKTKQGFERRKIKYKPTENRLDISAKTILDAIDTLDKRVKGIRAVYEVLCEFAHPNVGLLFGLTRNAKPVLATQRVGWVRKELSLEAPIGFVEDMGPTFVYIFRKVAECLNYFEILLLEADDERKKVLQITQKVLRFHLGGQRNILDVYAPCPCSSGSKIKFCCGSTKV